MILLRLFLSFFEIGLFSFGGGLATIPFIQALAEKTGWFDSFDIMNMIAISESTPGPLGINMATYIGYITGFIPGSLAAVIGLVLPSIIIILIVSKLFGLFKDNIHVKRALYGLRASSVALIFLAFFETFKIVIIDFDRYTNIFSIFEIIKIIPLFVSILIFILIRKFKLHPICYIAFAAILGIVLKF